MDIYDYFQNFKIRGAQKTADRAEVSSAGNKTQIDALQDQLDHLSLVSLAMVELLEEIGFNKSMLLKKIEEIDLRDGVKDGKYKQLYTCKNCSRKIAKRHVKCLYCGVKVDTSTLIGL